MTVQYDFKAFRNIEISGVSLSSFNDEELAVLYTHAKYTQAMVDADAETFREIVSEDKTFTHMSGKKAALFATSGGSPIGKSGEKILPYIKGAKLIDASLFSDASDEELKNWISRATE